MVATEGGGGDQRKVTTPKMSEALVSGLDGGGWWVLKGGGDRKKVATPKTSACARFGLGGGGWWVSKGGGDRNGRGG